MRPNERLRNERERRGWSQARLAETVGTDTGTVSRWERGATSPSPYFRERLCALFEKDARELGLVESEDEPSAIADSLQLAPLPGLRSRALACSAYGLGWFSGLVVALFSRSDRFALFHSVQSICVFGAAHVIVAVCTSIAPTLEQADARVPLYVIGSVTALVALITWLVAIVQAWRGRYYRAPLLGGLASRLTQWLADPRPA